MGGVEIPQTPRRWGVGRGDAPPHWGKGLGRELCPLLRKFFICLVEIPYFAAFCHAYFLNHTPMVGVLTPPLTPSSVRHWHQTKYYKSLI